MLDWSRGRIREQLARHHHYEELHPESKTMRLDPSVVALCHGLARDRWKRLLSWLCVAAQWLTNDAEEARGRERERVRRGRGERKKKKKAREREMHE